MKIAPPVRFIHTEIIAAYFRYKSEATLLVNCLSNWGKLLEGIEEGHDFTSKELENLIVKCEKRLEELVSKHNAYTLLFWSRRLAPRNIFHVAHESVRLYRDIMSLAIYKYGRQTDPQPYKGVLIPSSLCPYIDKMHEQPFEPEKVYTWPMVVYELDSTIEIECVSYIYTRLTQIYRWKGKGASVVLCNGELKIEASEELEASVMLYDERLKTTNILSCIGDWFEDKPGRSRNIIPIPSLNVEGTQLVKDYIIDVSNKNRRVELTMQAPNYLYSALDLTKYKEYISRYPDEIAKDYGFTPAEFISFLKALFVALIIPTHTSIHQCRDYNYCAYIIRRTETDDPTGELTQELWNDGKVQKEISQGRLRCVLKYFMNPSTEKLDLWTRRPKKLVYQLSPKLWVFDLSHLIYPIRDLLTPISERTGSTATARSTHFEDSVIKSLQKEYGGKHLWVCQQRIRGDVSEKEIDASVVINGTLFIIEAKAMKFSAELDCGKPKDIENRRKKLRQYLKQADENADYILKYKDSLHKPADQGGAHIAFPKDVQRICPVLVTAFPEYIWNMHDNKFLNSDKTLPRILTIEELPKLSELTSEELDACPFVINVHAGA